MKTYTCLFLMALLFCFCTGCAGSRDAADQDGQNDQNNHPFMPPESEIAAAPVVVTRIELVNNTGGEITVFEPGEFYWSSEYGLSLWGREKTAYTVDENETGAFEFFWTPGGNYIGVRDYYHPNDPPPSTAQENKENFRPFIQSFFLRIIIDGEDYYLAGWPQSVGLPSKLETGYGENAYTFDSSQITVYGIGYGDNKEARVEAYSGGYVNFWGDSGYAYIPVTVTSEGATYDFGNPGNVLSGVLMEAVLTIDGPGKIDFKTTSVSLMQMQQPY